MKITIKNTKIFRLGIWRKLPKLIKIMAECSLVFEWGADLGGADLGGANLGDANLRGANLGGANFGDANLGGADLGGTELKSIKNKKVIVEDFMSVCGLGSENRQTFFYKTNIGVVVQCGCFYGTEKEFKAKVKETHENNQYAKEYLTMLKVVKVRFAREEQ